MIERFACFEISYNEIDEYYIDLVLLELKEKYQDIMNFFGLNELKKTVYIKFWDNVDEFRDYFNKLEPNKKVQNWMVAKAMNNKLKSTIDILSLREWVKCDGHSKETLDSIIKTIIHEFVHICHLEYNNYQPKLTWIAEALATNLTHQFDSLKLDASIDDIINGTANTYKNYYTIGAYLFDKCDKEYILRVAKDKNFCLEETPKIYEETLKYVLNNNEIRNAIQ